MSNNQTNQAGHGQDNNQRDHRDAEVILHAEAIRDTETIAALNRMQENEELPITTWYSVGLCEPEPNNNAVAYTGTWSPTATSPEYTPTSLN